MKRWNHALAVIIAAVFCALPGTSSAAASDAAAQATQQALALSAASEDSSAGTSKEQELLAKHAQQQASYAQDEAKKAEDAAAAAKQEAEAAIKKAKEAEQTAYEKRKAAEDQQAEAAKSQTQEKAPVVQTPQVGKDIVPWVTPLTATKPVIVGTIAPYQMALGGLHVHDSVAQVKGYWEEPTTYSGHGSWLTYVYGTTFGLRFYKGGYHRQDYGIYEIATNAHNGICTPAGISVGAEDQTVLRLYGMPSRLTTACRENNYTTTFYYYGYATELGHELSFDIRECKVVKIRLRGYYEYPQHFSNR